MPFAGFAIERYLVKAVVSFCRLASMPAVMAVVKPIAVRESSSVSFHTFSAPRCPPPTTLAARQSKNSVEFR